MLPFGVCRSITWVSRQARVRDVVVGRKDAVLIQSCAPCAHRLSEPTRRDPSPEKEPAMAEQHDDFHRFTGTAGYIASAPLVDAVNCAVALERPLLIKGEPGTGKTLLARHVSEGLGMPMLSWHIKSTSKAADGLYVYDTIQRLNDARFGDGDVKDVRRYIKHGPLGRVFAAS